MEAHFSIVAAIAAMSLLGCSGGGSGTVGGDGGPSAAATGAEPLDGRVFATKFVASSVAPVITKMAFARGHAALRRTQAQPGHPVEQLNCYSFERRSSDTLRLTLDYSRTRQGETTVDTDGNAKFSDWTYELSDDRSKLYDHAAGQAYDADSSETATAILAECESH